MISKFAISLLQGHRRSMVVLLILGVLESIGTLCIAISFAFLVTQVFLEGVHLQQHMVSLYALVVSGIGKSWVHYIYEKKAQHIGSSVKAELRTKIIQKMYRLGGLQKSSDPVHLMTDGLDQIEAYIVRYIPQLLYAGLIPLIMGIAIIKSTPWIGIILLISFPLIPFFMIMIGKKAEKMNQEQWERMSFLSGHFLDVLQGIMTLKVFGRAKEQLYVIDRLAGEFKDSTLRVLRVAFLSALVLEMLSTISTALIAGYLGVALVFGEVEFFDAFLVLLLAPDFYAPLRQLGTSFHTGMAGNVSFEKVKEFLALSEYKVSEGYKQCISAPHKIVFSDVAFSYQSKNGETSSYAVEQINMTLEANKKVMLVGESGAGKSTITNLLLRLVDPLSGSITVDGTPISEIEMSSWRDEIVYLGQEPYLFTGTIASNISFGLSASDDEIIEAAKQAFIHDEIMKMPQGYDTIIGEGGFGVSGGQRQRIAIARAFLRNGHILILDEATARLDVVTEEQIGKSLEVLCRNKIVLFIGHRVQTMNWADEIYVMRNGRIIQEGTYETLRTKGYFKELIDAGLESKHSSIHPTLEFLRTSDTDSQNNRETEQTLVEDYSKNSDVNTIPKKHYRTFDFIKILWGVLDRAKASMLLSVGLNFLTVFMNVGLLTTSAWLIASAALHPELVYLSIAIVGVRFFGISRAVCRYGERYVSHHMAFQGLHALRVWFYKRLEPLAPAIFSKYSSGDMLNRIMTDIETLQFFYLRVLIPPVVAILMTAIGMYFFSFFGWTISISLLAFAIVGGVAIPLSVVYAVRTYTDQYLKYRSTCKSIAVEQTKGIIDTIAYGNEVIQVASLEESFSRSDAAHGRIEEILNRGNSAFLWLSLWAWPIGVILMEPIVDVGLWSGVYFAVIAISLQSYFECLQPMIQAALHGHESMGAMKRLTEISDRHEDLRLADELESMKKSSTNNELRNVQNNYKESDFSSDDGTASLVKEYVKAPSVDFHNIWFSYGEVPIYKGLSLSIRAGEKVAIVGPSGAGKSTLLQLLERFYDYNGTIAIDGQAIEEMDLEMLRHKMAYMTQDSYIFHASIKDNIRLAKPSATLDEIQQVIQLAQLEEWVNSLPQGMDTMIGTGGMGISGGQKQRIAIARLALRDAGLLLLDEPLEGLDQVTRHLVERAIFKLMTNRTCLYVTHHLKDLDEMDRILFIDEGQIVEEGTYDELMSRKGAFYKYTTITRTLF